uniref:CSON006232 protein n=1 Tax=Culicoides sonorensis TaxID=179676 RepID=A0A336MU91_CULSO
MQERRGLVHINMMDLLQQYAIGNEHERYCNFVRYARLFTTLIKDCNGSVDA